MTEQGVLLLAGVIGFVMCLQLVLNTGDTARSLKRIEKQLEDRDRG